MKILIYIVFIILFILVTFFGLGPVMMADGPASERIVTLAVVVVVYIILALLLRFFIKLVNNR